VDQFKRLICFIIPFSARSRSGALFCTAEIETSSVYHDYCIGATAIWSVQRYNIPAIAFSGLSVQLIEHWVFRFNSPVQSV